MSSVPITELKHRLELRHFLLWATLGLFVSAIGMGVWKRPEPVALDFHTYEAAALVGLQHGWSHLYDQSLVSIAQIGLAPDQLAQPFLSPPPVAWLVVPFLLIPYGFASVAWSTITTLALAAAVAWSSGGRQLERWVAAALVVTPWWILVADRVGQVVPFVAVGVILAWRWLREDREIAAGLALGLILLKPNTAFLVPMAVLAARRQKVFFSWSIVALVVAGVVLFTTGPQSVAQYVNELQHPPPGTDALSLEAAFGVSGLTAVAIRIAIVIAVVGAATRLRMWPGMVVALGLIGSLLVTPYLHLSDLTLLAAAGWMVWCERPGVMWRCALAASWIFVSPFAGTSLNIAQSRWPLFELAWLGILAGAAVTVHRPDLWTFPSLFRGTYRGKESAPVLTIKVIRAWSSIRGRLVSNRTLVIALIVVVGILIATAVYAQAARGT